MQRIFSEKKMKKKKKNFLTEPKCREPVVVQMGFMTLVSSEVLQTHFNVSLTKSKGYAIESDQGKESTPII